MKWKQRSQYCIESGNYRISKTYHPEPRYQLWVRGEQKEKVPFGWVSLGMFNSADEAKEAI